VIFWKINFWLLLYTLFAMCCVGCTESLPTASSSDPTTKPESSNQAKGFEILKQQRQWESGDVAAKSRQLWSEVQQAYSEMERYSDQAQVQLRYELFGNVMLEAMPVSVSYDRASGDWQAHQFRAHLSGDRQNIAISIKEPATNNLDRQVKLVAAENGILQLAVNDPVAQIYLSGATDIPLSEKASTGLVLLAPQLEWLASEGPSSTDCSYRGWTVYNDHVCVKILRKTRGYETEYWIDPDQKQIRRMVLANSLLHAELAETPEVQGLQIQIDFSEIQVGENARRPSGLKELPSDRTVRRFVKIPEAFPSPWIGRRSPELTLRTHEHTSLRLPESQRATIAVFMSPLEANAAWWQVLERLAGENQASSANVVLVLDGIATQPTTTNVAHRPVGTVNPQLVSLGAEAWQTLGLNQGRWLVIWDATGIVQYVGVAEIDHLADTTVKVLQRLQKGEAIGEEMIREYQAFYSEYIAQLEAQQVEVLPSTVGTLHAESGQNNRSTSDNPQN
jgi:hypothetical protein